MRIYRLLWMMVFVCTLLGCSTKQPLVVTDVDELTNNVVAMDGTLPTPAQDALAGDVVVLEDADAFDDEYVEDDYFSDEDYDTPTQEIYDPLIGWNRFWFGVNDVFYLDIIDPLYTGYAFVTPQALRTGLANVSHNIAMPIRFANALLQGDFGGAVIEIGKFLVNTFVGFGGFADVSKEKELLVPYNPRNSRFGTTLAVWGVGEGMYLVLPFFGPSGLREGVGLAGDFFASPFTWAAYVGDINIWASYGIAYTLTLNDFSSLLDGYKTMTKSAVEPYIAVRQAYLAVMRARLQALENMKD